MIPGFVASGSDAADVSAADTLLGSVRFEVGAVRDPSQGASAQRGNGFYAGVTFGPETYRDATGNAVAGQGQSLAGAAMGIAIGGVEMGYTNLTTSAGAKLVERPGGVTGAFNFTGAPAVALYGYETVIDAFSFRVADSAIDAGTGGFDGKVTVKGPADFAVAFLHLALECTGHVGGGVVDPDPVKNPPQRLRAWNAPFAIRTVGFAPVAGDGQCSSTGRELRVGGGVRVEDLERSLDIDAG